MDNGLCRCGCGGKPTVATKTNTAQGRVKGQPNRYVNGHNARRGPIDYLEDENGCWIWQRFTNPAGYGMLGRGGGKKLTLAHRWYYELKHGAVAEGLELDHLCRVRACVNPDHLEPVTSRENSHRGIRTKLTAHDVRAIDRAYLASGQKLRPFASENASRWGIAPDHLRKVVRRTSGLWSNVPRP